MGDDASKNEGCQEREREDEGIEESIVPLPHTVANPRTVMIKPFWRGGKSNTTTTLREMASQKTKEATQQRQTL